MLTLYGHGSRTAANILKIRVALAEAGQGYEYVALDLSNGAQHKPEYLAINPHAKVPVLVDDDFALPESDAILWYLAEKFPAAALLPADLRERARVRQWCDFACTSLYTSSYDLYLNTQYGDAANHSDWVAERAKTALVRALGVLEKRLAGRQFVATEALTIADLGIAAVVHMLVSRTQLVIADYANIEAHYRAISMRPAWVAAVADNPQLAQEVTHGVIIRVEADANVPRGGSLDERRNLRKLDAALGRRHVAHSRERRRTRCETAP